jgi:hypothetical protein
MGRTLGMVTACMLIAGSTMAFADEITTAGTTAAPNAQVASVTTAVSTSDAKAPVDPLHADAHWPLFSNCINNTTTPDAFQACLQLAFMGVGPNDQVLALLTH